MFQIEINLRRNAKNTFCPHSTWEGKRVNQTGHKHPFSGLSARPDEFVKLSGREHTVYAKPWRVVELVGRKVSRDEIRHHGDYTFYRFGGNDISSVSLEKFCPEVMVEE